MSIPEANIWKPVKSSGLLDQIGPLMARKDGDGWRYGIATDDRHVNPIGVIHGGTLATLADQAMSILAWEAANRQPVVTININTDYINSARPGIFLEAKPEVIERKGSMIFLEVRISGENKLLAKASSVMKILQSR